MSVENTIQWSRKAYQSYRRHLSHITTDRFFYYPLPSLTSTELFIHRLDINHILLVDYLKRVVQQVVLQAYLTYHPPPSTFWVTNHTPQLQPKDTRGNQGQPKANRSYQRKPRATKSKRRQPKATKGYSKQPKATKGN